MFSNVYCIYARKYNILPAGGILVESFFRRSSLMRERERERGSSVRGLKEGRRKCKRSRLLVVTEKSNQSSRLRSIAVRWFAPVLFFSTGKIDALSPPPLLTRLIVQFHTRPVSSLDLRLFQSSSTRITMLRRT